MKACKHLLSTAEVCKILGITPAKVHQLINEGYLEVIDTTRLKHGVANFFQAAQVEKLIEQMPRILRRWHSEENARLGAKNAAVLRVKRRHAAQNVKSQKEVFLSSINLAPESIYRLLRAAYFLYHLNHYAKTGNEYLYDLKEQVLYAFYQRYSATDCLKIFFIPGEQHIKLCPKCKRKAQQQRISYSEYARHTGGCNCCVKDDRHYSLYEFVIDYDEYHFCFHTPYTVARKWFKGKKIPTKFSSSRYEMGTNFGRSIFELEAKAIPLAEVISELKDFLDYVNQSALSVSRS